MVQYFDEATAQDLLNRGQLDDCIRYARPCVAVELLRAKQSLPSQTQWEDLEGEYNLYLTLAVHRYDRTKGSRLFTWITNYLRYGRLNFIKREAKFGNANIQLDQHQFIITIDPPGL